MILRRPSVIASLAGVLSFSSLCRGGELSDSSIAREWSDSTGKFHAIAKLVGGDESRVRLLKQTGSTITVPMSRLSAADRQFVRDRLRLAGRDARQHPGASSQVNKQAVSLNPTKLLSKAVAWLDGFKTSSPTETNGASARNLIRLSGVSPLLSENAAKLPENMVYVRASLPFLRRWAERDVSYDARVSDNILGTPVVGNSTTFSHVQFDLQPNRQAAVGVLRLSGTTKCSTVGDGGPVHVFSSGFSQFQSAKTVWFDRDGIHSTPAVTNAQTRLVTTGFDTSLPRLRGRIALRIAGNRAAANRGAAEAITAEHLSQRVNRRFDGSTKEELAALWRVLSTQIPALAADNPLRPRGWHASSTNDRLEIVAIGPPGDGSGYVPAPTTELGSADVRVDIHVAVIKRALGDATLKKAIAPALALLATVQSAEPAPRPTIDWSADHNWLSIAWSSAGSRQEPQDRTAAALKTAR
jgi:hypothetical protein